MNGPSQGGISCEVDNDAGQDSSNSAIPSILKMLKSPVPAAVVRRKRVVPTNHPPSGQILRIILIVALGE